MTNRTYLNVPYAQKDEAKRLGARWDPSNKAWYIPSTTDTTPFQLWLPHPSDALRSGYLRTLAREHEAFFADEDAEVEPDPDRWRLFVELAHALKKPVRVLLLQQACWRCSVLGYAIELHLPCDPAHLEVQLAGRLPIDALPNAIHVYGGEVGMCFGLRDLLATSPRLDAKSLGRVATIQHRFSHTVGEAYLSQGCSSCNALWGDFPLLELHISYIHRMVDFDYDQETLFCALEIDFT